MFRTLPIRVNRMDSFWSTISPALTWPVHALLPATCCLCGAPGAARKLDLCRICLTLLPLNSAPASVVHSLAPTVERVVAPFRYAYPVHHWIRALKFRGERVYARVLGLLLAQAIRDSRQPLPERLVPVPLHPRRYQRRGFNQAHEIARFTAAELGIPVSPRVLVRRVHTPEQSGLSMAQRRRNVRGAFAIRQSLEGQHVALLDDVLTTGSTALAAAKALRDAGATRVEVWVAAYVPPVERKSRS